MEQHQLLEESPLKLSEHTQKFKLMPSLKC